MKVLFIILCLVWLFFVGEWIYGMVSDKKNKSSYFTSKHTYIGLLGFNITALCIKIVAIIV